MSTTETTTSAQKFARTVIFALLAFAVTGVTAGLKDFVKTKVGPFYILEPIAALCFLLAPFAAPDFKLRKAFRDLKWPLVFFGWGMLLVGYDVASNLSNLSAVSWHRVFQHGVIFAYPLIWMSLGYWTYSTEKRWMTVLITLIALLSIPRNLRGVNVPNISTGPFLAVFFAPMLYQALWEKRPKRWRTVMASVVLGFFTFLPLWVMWYHGFLQRTTLLSLTLMVVSIPFLIRKHGDSLLRPAASVGVSVIAFLLGIYVATLWSNYDLSHAFMRNMRHGEDATYMDEGPLIQARFRKAMWLSAISQWRTRPLTGIGFVPEVPKDMESGPNIGGWEHPGAPPISGPHCSYLSVLARMGVIGAVIFVLFGGVWLVRGIRLISTSSFSHVDLLMIFIPLGGAVYALVNVGFEGPHRSMLMWLLAGAMTARSSGLPRASRIS
ncbi:MAG: O-antigen ligase family protein [Bdellovibrionota bacterium]